MIIAKIAIRHFTNAKKVTKGEYSICCSFVFDRRPIKIFYDRQGTSPFCLVTAIRQRVRPTNQQINERSYRPIQRSSAPTIQHYSGMSVKLEGGNGSSWGSQVIIWGKRRTSRDIGGDIGGGRGGKWKSELGRK